MNKKKFFSLLISTVLAAFALLIPPSYLGIPDLSIIEQRIIALFILAASLWVTEAIPIWTTSVLTIVLMLLTTSTSGLSFLMDADGGECVRALGNPIKYKAIMATFADPIIMLFMGGFVLAIASTKVGLDANLARVLLKPFGTRSEFVLMGFLLVTGVFSMFMSNTATAAMMLAIMAPVLKILPPDGKGRIALALSIPIGANIGGIGSPIGTPPNMIALKFLSESGVGIGFGEWMSFMVPYVLVILFIAWILLIKIFPFKKKNIEIKIDGEFRKDSQAVIVYVTFALTVILWLLGSKITGLNAEIVALIPFAVFAVTKVITKDDLKEINWDVLWLVAGGFALGLGLQETGLAEHLIKAIPFGTWPPILVLVGSGVLCCVMSTFMSNTATASLLVPILAAVGKGMGDVLSPFGGPVALLIGIAISASLAMALPISTPPNALAHATGLVKQKEMAVMGVLIGVIGVVLAYVMLIVLSNYGIIGGSF